MLAPFWKQPFAVRLAITLWVALIVGVTIRVLVQRPTAGSVLPIYLNAGLRWAASEDLYAPAPPLDVYRNPPGFAAMFAPAVSLSPKLVGLLWRWGSVAVFLLGLLRVQRAIFPHWTITQQAWYFSLAVFLVLPAFNNGQVNLLLAACLLHTIADLAMNNFWRCSLWLALATWLKLYPLAFAMLALIVNPRELSWRFLLCCLIGFAQPLLAQNPEYVLQQYRNFWGYLGTDDRSLAELARAPRTWAIIPRGVFGVMVLPMVEKLIAACAGLACAWLVWRSDPRDQLLKLLTLGGAWMTVFGPATEANTYALCAGAVALNVVAKPGWLGVLGYGLMWLTVVRGLFPNDWRWQVLGLQPLGMLLLSASCLMGVAVESTTVILEGRIRIPGRVVVPDEEEATA